MIDCPDVPFARFVTDRRPAVICFGSHRAWLGPRASVTKPKAALLRSTLGLCYCHALA